MKSSDGWIRGIGTGQFMNAEEVITLYEKREKATVVRVKVKKKKFPFRKKTLSSSSWYESKPMRQTTFTVDDAKQLFPMLCIPPPPTSTATNAETRKDNEKCEKQRITETRRKAKKISIARAKKKKEERLKKLNALKEEIANLKEHIAKKKKFKLKTKYRKRNKFSHIQEDDDERRNKFLQFQEARKQRKAKAVSDYRPASAPVSRQLRPKKGRMNEVETLDVKPNYEKELKKIINEAEKKLQEKRYRVRQRQRRAIAARNFKRREKIVNRAIAKYG
eukprot:g1241.t1